MHSRVRLPVQIDGELVKDIFRGGLPAEYVFWLLRHYGLSRRVPPLSLFVTSACNRHCQECIQRNLVSDPEPTHMSLEELDQLIRASEESRYVFDFIISGGEPLLWRHLKEGVRRLRASGICHSITLFTNAIDIRGLDDDIAACLDTIRISRYSNNHGNLEDLLRRYGGKVQIVERERVWVNPGNAIPNSLPPRCCTPHPWVFGGRVYFCAHCASISKGRAHDAGLSNPVRAGFLKGLYRIRKRQERHVCGYCFHNLKVRAQLALADNAAGVTRL